MQSVHQAKPSKAIYTAIWLSFAGLVGVAFLRNVNWDEFYFLSHVHAFIDGRLDRPLQTVFVHAFTWLAKVSDTEINQIIAARLVMVALLGVTALSIYRIAAHLTDKAAAAIAVLAFLMSGYVFPHGASFRADPIAAAFLSAAAAVMLTTQMRAVAIVCVAICSAFAVLVTIKSALFAPAFVAIMLWRWSDQGAGLRIIFAGILALVIAGALYFWHASGIVPAVGNETAANMREAATAGLLQAGLLPRASYVAMWAVLSVGALVLSCFGVVRSGNAKHAALLVLLAAPLLSVLIYRNAYPYFFPFAAPLLMVAVAFGTRALRGSKWLPRLVMVMFVTGAVQFVMSITEGQSAQRATLAEVHRLFPQPVAYLDDSNMVSTFPNVGPFLSSWGIQQYQAAGVPIFADIIANEKPPLLLTTKWPLIQTMFRPGSNVLLAEDAYVLQNTYLHYSGAIWLAGLQVTLTGDAQQVNLPFAGRYRVVSKLPLVINGLALNDGDVVDLAAAVTVKGTAESDLQLIWDTGVPPVDTPLPTTALFADFWTLW